jgi:hypothetical protein
MCGASRGGHKSQGNRCGHEEIRYNSCRKGRMQVQESNMLSHGRLAHVQTRGLSTSDRILTSYDNVVSGDGAELYAALCLPPWAPWLSPWSTLSLPGACLIDG